MSVIDITLPSIAQNAREPVPWAPGRSSVQGEFEIDCGNVTAILTRHGQDKQTETRTSMTGEPHDEVPLETPLAALKAKLRSVLSKTAIVVSWGLTILLVSWGAAALYIDVRISWLNTPLTLAFLIATITVTIRVKRKRLALVLCLATFAPVLIWWLSLRPSNDRDWTDDVAVLPYAEIEGHRVTLHNIRNCAYRTDTDFDVHHYDRTVDLDQLQTADLFIVFWGSPWIAHTMMSFGFADGYYLCVSIETRREKSEVYSPTKGFFRQFELTYVVSDERDVVRLRTNYRKEDVYLYRLVTDRDTIRRVFLGYLKHINALHKRPEWYNALTSNCTSNIRGHTKAYAANRAWDWRMLLNGHIDEMVYERRGFDQSLPFEKLKQRSLINSLAQAADRAEDFSRQIRLGLPGFSATPTGYDTTEKTEMAHDTH